MLIKLLIVIVILFLLRRHMGILRPFWPQCVGLIVGAFMGWWLATMAINTGVNFGTLVYLGCPQKLIKPFFAAVGALTMVGPVSAAIRSLFP